MQITIELPGIKAISRNKTLSSYWAYERVLNEAEGWMVTFGKRFEHHFASLVDVRIDAYFKVGYNKLTRGVNKCPDSPNIDAKIFTDVLVRYKKQKGKGAVPLERLVWFIEDDSPKYLRDVVTRAIPSTENKVVIIITEVEDV